MAVSQQKIDRKARIDEVEIGARRLRWRGVDKEQSENESGGLPSLRARARARNDRWTRQSGGIWCAETISNTKSMQHYAGSI